MSATTRAVRVQTRDLILAAVLLIGVLALGFGYFQSSRVAFYAGLFVTIGGVLSGAMRLVGHR